MLRLPNNRLPEPAAVGLKTMQAAIDGLPTYREQVAAAKLRFSRANTKKDPVFKEVRATLERMASGARRCGYCEDSLGDEVEHIRPKDLYPDVVFTWTNYLYACGNCNGPKNNRYSILQTVGGATIVVSVTRKRGDPINPPLAGAPALIDPRREDPLDFMMLDLRQTFWFVPRGAPGSAGRARAEFTIELLHLNDRDFLAPARQGAYESYLSHLTRYVTQKQAHAAPAELRRIKRAILNSNHPTVWAEMKRQQQAIPELAALFTAAPEALGW